MPDVGRERVGRTMTLWISFDEIDALGEAAKVVGVSRNEAARQAIREFCDTHLSAVGRPASKPQPR
jgi:hypothetical protein